MECLAACHFYSDKTSLHILLHLVPPAYRLHGATAEDKDRFIGCAVRESKNLSTQTKKEKWGHNRKKPSPRKESDYVSRELL